MAKIQPDFSEAVRMGATVPGLYRLQIVGSKLVESKEKKTRMIEWHFLVNDTIKAGDLSEVGRELIRNTPIEGKGAGFLEETLKAAGRDDLTGDNKRPFDTEELHGTFIGAEITNRKYKDEQTGEEREAPEIRRMFKLSAT